MLFQNLFAFGDKDGTLCDAKLQHLLGLAISSDENTLLVADTYNHKLKKVNIGQNSITTLNASTIDFPHGKTNLFNEPSGLCLSSNGKLLYVADTNNHQIKVVKVDSNFSMKLVKHLELTLDQTVSETDSSKHRVYNTTPISISKKGGKLIFDVKFQFKNGLKLTEDAPQSWKVCVPYPTWSCVPNGADNLKDVDVVVSVPERGKGNLDFFFDLVTCTTDTCLPIIFIVRVPIESNNPGNTSASKEITIALGPNSVEIL